MNFLRHPVNIIEEELEALYTKRQQLKNKQTATLATVVSRKDRKDNSTEEKRTISAAEMILYERLLLERVKGREELEHIANKKYSWKKRFLAVWREIPEIEERDAAIRILGDATARRISSTQYQIDDQVYTVTFPKYTKSQ